MTGVCGESEEGAMDTWNGSKQILMDAHTGAMATKDEDTEAGNRTPARYILSDCEYRTALNGR